MSSKMKIEKISRYVPIATSSRSSTDTDTIRHMLVSLPRVRWLEREDISDLSLNKYKTEGEPIELYDHGSYVALTQRERLMHNMFEKGMSVFDIAKEKSMNTSNVARIIDTAQKKLAKRAALKDDGGGC